MSTPDADAPQHLRVRALSLALRRRNICIFRQDNDHRFELAENLPTAWPWRDMVGRRETEALPEPLGARFAEAYEICRDRGHEQVVELDLVQGATRRLFEAHMLPDGGGVVTVLVDVTDERSREAAVASLLREVSHRSKNLLAIVQSVAMQTAHHSEDVEDFLVKFRGRLHALSSTQDLVTESNWRGTYLHSLVASQLTRAGSVALANVRITGVNPLLGPNASLHIGLAIHELAANAVLHGALADDDAGHVWFDARFTELGAPSPELILEWQETGISAPEARRTPRFGTLVLERIVPLSVGGSAELTISADAVNYRLRVPADQFEV